MHMNHRPIVPVRNAAEVAYKKVAASSLHANPSSLSRLDAKEIFLKKQWLNQVVLIGTHLDIVTRKNGRKNFAVVGTGFQNDSNAECMQLLVCGCTI